MPRVEKWDFRAADKMVQTESHKRALKAAEVIATMARWKCPVGTISRPMYKTGPYAGQPYTSRDAGRLRKSIRVVERNEEKYGYAFWISQNLGFGNVRVYAGHKAINYAQSVEHYTPFLGPAVESTKGAVKKILESG